MIALCIDNPRIQGSLLYLLTLTLNIYDGSYGYSNTIHKKNGSTHSLPAVNYSIFNECVCTTTEQGYMMQVRSQKKIPNSKVKEIY
jgi:hypothetical protein